jgi:hypothetical protein
VIVSCPLVVLGFPANTLRGAPVTIDRNNGCAVLRAHQDSCSLKVPQFTVATVTFWDVMLAQKVMNRAGTVDSLSVLNNVRNVAR